MIVNVIQRSFELPPHADAALFTVLNVWHGSFVHLSFNVCLTVVTNPYEYRRRVNVPPPERDI